MPPEHDQPPSARDDEHPILHSLLDSLNALNERLNVIENVLAVPDHKQLSATPQTVRKTHARVPTQHRDSQANTSISRQPLPSTAPPLPPLHQPLPSATQFAAATTPSSSIPSPTSFSIPPTGTPIPYSPYDIDPSKPSPTSISSSKRSSQPSHATKSRVKFEDDNSDGDLEASNSRPADKDDDDEDDDDDNDDDDEQQGRIDEAGGSGEGGSTSGTLPKELQPTGVGESRLEALPEGFVVSGRATLQEELDGWTIPRGYSMRINGTRSHGRRQKIRMVCFRGGRSRLRPKEEEAKREREKERLQLFPDLPPRRRKPTTDRISKKCECPFRFELVEVRPGADRYAVHYTNDDHMQHNHAAADLMLDPRARKLPRALKAEVDQWLRDASTVGTGGNSKGGGDTNNTGGGNGSSSPGWTIAKIQAELQRRGYGHVLDFDLRNRKRALLHRDRMAQLKNENDGGSGGDTPAATS
ncbi:uncharacterized protein SPSK_09215 [Sporothrix schenckii 1099-18]|uniref:Uncharacterized protein n=2 Tax=Sporothrix schenckii TaxID=29908 RepID=U7Q7R9_SPOS1|nr:uncharacterized protein SPSK_09215 [Sporothrix schenckii 1099-18]ERT03262.1 hypothetical protein HMPREF1624_01568 [Sporothrix schenckii ATCC 58251]KJR84309.1 hypothetical protein SPSK_09215 [Sporothrix schenckii 1099-18]